MPVEMTPVVSSLLREIGHEGTTLWVRFRNGTLYTYEGVTKEMHDAILGAESAGKYFSSTIKTKFTGVPVAEKINAPKGS